MSYQYRVTATAYSLNGQQKISATLTFQRPASTSDIKDAIALDAAPRLGDMASHISVELANVTPL